MREDCRKAAKTPSDWRVRLPVVYVLALFVLLTFACTDTDSSSPRLHQEPEMGAPFQTESEVSPELAEYTATLPAATRTIPQSAPTPAPSANLPDGAALPTPTPTFTPDATHTPVLLNTALTSSSDTPTTTSTPSPTHTATPTITYISTSVPTSTASTTPAVSVPRWERLGFEDAFDGQEFHRPLDMRVWHGGGFAVADRAGTISLHFAGKQTQILLDLTDIIEQRGSEDGLLSAAIDPEFETHPFIYIYYTPEKHLSRLSRFPVEDYQVIHEEELVMLDIYQPTTSSHNGGAILFGPDGMMYLGVGDGGGYDGRETAQDLSVLLGKIIRIDVRDASDEQPYKAPQDNPMLSVPDARPEIYAYGLRNPWRMSFDRNTGELWVGDVGGAKREEVNIVQAGANYGWGAFEGELCVHYPDEYCANLLDSVVMPVFSYPHGGEYGCAIIGGTVYRGSAIPWLNGMYIFGDYCNENIRALERNAEADGTVPYCSRADLEAQTCDGAESGWTAHVIKAGVRYLQSFAVDSDGEIYLLAAGKKPILKLVELPEARLAE